MLNFKQLKKKLKSGLAVRFRIRLDVVELQIHLLVILATILFSAPRPKRW